MKRCVRCEVVKRNREFSVASKSVDGLQSWCKECCREYNRVYRLSVKGVSNAPCAEVVFRRFEELSEPEVIEEREHYGFFRRIGRWLGLAA